MKGYLIYKKNIDLILSDHVRKSLLNLMPKLKFLLFSLINMALPVMEFQVQGYKIRKIFA